MRKYIILALVLACISAGSILWAYTDLNGQQDDIAIKETIEAGKAEATKGIKVSTRVLDPTYRLNWDTDMFLDGSGEIKSKTQFIYDRTNKVKFHDVSEDRYQVIEQFNFDSAFFSRDELQSGKGTALGTQFPMKLLQDAYDASGGQERFTWQCNLDDYMEYFPVDIDTECIYYDHIMMTTDSDIHGKKIDWTNYFRFPVPEDFPYLVQIMESGGEDLVGFNMMASQKDDSYYSLNSDGFWDEDGLYLAVSGIEEVGSGDILVDAPKEKRGIHFIPTKDDVYTFLVFDEAEMVYPVDAGVKVIDLTPSEDGKTIYMLTKSEAGLFVDIIDKKNMACRQKLQLSKTFQHTASFGTCKVGEDWLFYNFDRGDFVLIAEKEGAYEEVMADTVGHVFEAYYMGCDYDGERLAIATTEWDSNVIETQLRVFDKDGCLYRGRFDYSNAHAYYNDESYEDGYDKRVYVEFTDEI